MFAADAHAELSISLYATADRELSTCNGYRQELLTIVVRAFAKAACRRRRAKRFQRTGSRPETAAEFALFFAFGLPRAIGEHGAELVSRTAQSLLAPFRDEGHSDARAQQRMIGERDFWSLRPAMLPIDAGAVHARRIMERLIATKRGKAYRRRGRCCSWGLRPAAKAIDKASARRHIAPPARQRPLSQCLPMLACVGRTPPTSNAADSPSGSDTGVQNVRLLPIRLCSCDARSPYSSPANCCARPHANRTSRAAATPTGLRTRLHFPFERAQLRLDQRTLARLSVRVDASSSRRERN